jgi:hypothetical protein
MNDSMMLALVIWVAISIPASFLLASFLGERPRAALIPLPVRPHHPRRLRAVR